MALSMDEQRELEEIERRLGDDDPVLAARLTAFRVPRLSLGPRSARARLVASIGMLAVVAIISVFVYALMPFRSQAGQATDVTSSASASNPAMSAPAITAQGQSTPLYLLPSQGSGLNRSVSPIPPGFYGK
jgi:hypothetical protein